MAAHTNFEAQKGGRSLGPGGCANCAATNHAHHVGRPPNPPYRTTTEGIDGTDLAEGAKTGPAENHDPPAA